MQCDLCGVKCGRFMRTPYGAVACDSHPWCDACDQRHLEVPCREVQLAVRTVSAAERAGNVVRRNFRQLGIEFPRVPLTLVSHIDDGVLGVCRTRVERSSTGERRTASIEILNGMGRSKFGHIFIHEHVHALLHLSGAPDIGVEAEEGICELVAWHWLCRRRTPRRYLHHVLHNNHPVYGPPLRHALATTKDRSAVEVLRSIIASGQLPLGPVLPRPRN